MKTLDRYVIRSFLWSVLLLLVTMLALRIVSDLFLNMDEFMEDKGSVVDTITHIMTYYGYQTLIYFTELGGAVIVVAAAFTMARMNHTNELTAMLAAGVSLHRVILPVIVVAMLLCGLIIIDREVLIPANSQHLLKSRDEAREIKTFPVYLPTDGSGDVWWSAQYNPATRTMHSPTVAIRYAQKPLANLHSVGGKGKETQFETADGKRLRGWDVTAASLGKEAGEPWLNTPSTSKIYTSISPQVLLEDAKRLAREAGVQVPPDRSIPGVSGIRPAVDKAYGLTVATRCGFDAKRLQLELDEYRQGQPRGGTINNPVFTFAIPVTDNDGKAAQRTLGIFHADRAKWVPAKTGSDREDSHWLLENGRLFFPSDLTNDDLTLRQSSRWLELMSLKEIFQLLERDKVPDRNAAILARHTRIAEPINNLILLLLGLPFILSRERNIKASAGLALLMTGAYFAFVHVSRLVGLPPMLAAFLPIVLFGTVAAVMLDSIKT